MQIWSTRQQSCVSELSLRANVCCAQYNPFNEHEIAAGCADHKVYVFDLRKPKQALHSFAGAKILFLSSIITTPHPPSKALNCLQMHHTTPKLNALQMHHTIPKYLQNLKDTTHTSSCIVSLFHVWRASLCRMSDLEGNLPCPWNIRVDIACNLMLSCTLKGCKGNALRLNGFFDNFTRLFHRVQSVLCFHFSLATIGIDSVTFFLRPCSIVSGSNLTSCAGHTRSVSYVRYMTASNLVSASTDSSLKLWDEQRKSLVRTYAGHRNCKNFVGLAADGEFIASGSETREVIHTNPLVSWSIYFSAQQSRYIYLVPINLRYLGPMIGQQCCLPRPPPLVSLYMHQNQRHLQKWWQKSSSQAILVQDTHLHSTSCGCNTSPGPPNTVNKSVLQHIACMQLIDCM